MPDLFSELQPKKQETTYRSPHFPETKISRERRSESVDVSKALKANEEELERRAAEEKTERDAEIARQEKKIYLQNRVSEVQQRLDELEIRKVELEVKIDGLKQDNSVLNRISNWLGSFGSKKKEKSLDQKIDELETKLENVTESIAERRKEIADASRELRAFRTEDKDKVSMKEFNGLMEKRGAEIRAEKRPSRGMTKELKDELKGGRLQIEADEAADRLRMHEVRKEIGMVPGEMTVAENMKATARDSANLLSGGLIDDAEQYRTRGERAYEKSRPVIDTEANPPAYTKEEQAANRKRVQDKAVERDINAAFKRGGTAKVVEDLTDEAELVEEAPKKKAPELKAFMIPPAPKGAPNLGEAADLLEEGGQDTADLVEKLQVFARAKKEGEAKNEDKAIDGYIIRAGQMEETRNLMNTLKDEQIGLKQEIAALEKEKQARLSHFDAGTEESVEWATKGIRKEFEAYEKKLQAKHQQLENAKGKLQKELSKEAAEMNTQYNLLHKQLLEAEQSARTELQKTRSEQTRDLDPKIQNKQEQLAGLSKQAAELEKNFGKAVDEVASYGQKVLGVPAGMDPILNPSGGSRLMEAKGLGSTHAREEASKANNREAFQGSEKGSTMRKLEKTGGEFSPEEIKRIQQTLAEAGIDAAKQWMTYAHEAAEISGEAVVSRKLANSMMRELADDVRHAVNERNEKKKGTKKAEDEAKKAVELARQAEKMAEDKLKGIKKSLETMELSVDVDLSDLG